MAILLLDVRDRWLKRDMRTLYADGSDETVCGDAPPGAEACDVASG